MKALLVGSGGREHALAWKLAKEGWEVLVAPGNAGIALNFAIVGAPVHDRMQLLEAATAFGPDLVIIGPEDPLIAGLADMFRENGYAVFGPGMDAARLEGSKSFSKDMMKRAEVPTADYQTFSHSGQAIEYLQEKFDLGKQVAVKASGAALGKGVVVCSTFEEAREATIGMLDEHVMGDAGKSVVIEERLFGREFSLLTVVSGNKIVSLPVAQDYKQIFDGDEGPNTGGMGTYSPVDWLTQDTVLETEDRVVRPILKLFSDLGIDYRGTLFSGLMLSDGDVKCLEYNVRFGDPEIQTIVRRLESGFGDLLMAAASGVELVAPVVSQQSAVTVVCASAGYPGDIEKGQPITMGDMPAGVEVFYAGVAKGGDGGLVTSGGRVLGVSAVGETLESARELAYLGVDQVEFAGNQYRSDIGSGAIR